MCLEDTAMCCGVLTACVLGVFAPCLSFRADCNAFGNLYGLFSKTVSGCPHCVRDLPVLFGDS